MRPHGKAGCFPTLSEQCISSPKTLTKRNATAAAVFLERQAAFLFENDGSLLLSCAETKHPEKRGPVRCLVVCGGAAKRCDSERESASSSSVRKQQEQQQQEQQQQPPPPPPAAAAPPPSPQASSTPRLRTHELPAENHARCQDGHHERPLFDPTTRAG